MITQTDSIDLLQIMAGKTFTQKVDRRTCEVKFIYDTDGTEPMGEDYAETSFLVHAEVYHGTGTEDDPSDVEINSIEDKHGADVKLNRYAMESLEQYLIHNY